MATKTEPITHWAPKTRSAFELEHGVTFCLRCGVIIEWDEHPELVRERQCHTFHTGWWAWPYPGEKKR